MGEIWVLLALAALIGLIAGWLIWGRRSTVTVDTSEADSLRADLGACRRAGADKDARIASLEADLASCQAEASDARMSAAMLEDIVEGDAEEAAEGADEGVDYDGDGVIEGTDEGTRPEALSGPRDGKADDLKRIKGVGPKMEQLCNKLGFYHFDQIAAWTADEVAWVDANLEGFKGRVSRDDWVAQAKLLAAGGETEFSKKVDKGDVY
ncbi:MAG TPA: hypothetical protein ENK83_03050 [Aliiroseovarius sp.]|nr:hypothetical protein [Aliiroseovarius sp.]